MVQTLRPTCQESYNKQAVTGQVVITDPSQSLCTESTHITNMQGPGGYVMHHYRRKSQITLLLVQVTGNMGLNTTGRRAR